MQPAAVRSVVFPLLDQAGVSSGRYIPSFGCIVPAMTYRAVLRGYMLEEALAWLLRNMGYRLLVHDSQDH